MLKTVSILVSGKVQGVWYRKYTLDKAVQLQLTGTVRNTAAGDVLIVATGKASQLADFIEWCRIGSPNSNVSAVTVEEMELTAFERFEVVR